MIEMFFWRTLFVRTKFLLISQVTKKSGQSIFDFVKFMNASGG